MPHPPGRFPEHVIRLGVVVVLFLGSVVAIRSFVVPASLKEKGYHRTSTMEREAARPLHYAGADVCRDCHDAQYQVKSGGYHRMLACETCHGPAKSHADDPSTGTPPAPRTRDFCPQCHAYDLARPTGFPQINPITHNPMQACYTCHDPHDPRPPTVPQECGACHASIARTKALSPHSLLACTTCHNVPDQHKVTPRKVRAMKPVERTFCAQCHGKSSAVVGTPKIDVDSHYQKYLCWDCHYPHMPEAAL